MFNLLATSPGSIGFAAVRGAGNEEAGIGKLRISEMLQQLLILLRKCCSSSFFGNVGSYAEETQIKILAQGGKSILETSRRGNSQSLANSKLLPDYLN